jgi:hypothetical protein
MSSNKEKYREENGSNERLKLSVENMMINFDLHNVSLAQAKSLGILASCLVHAAINSTSII